MEARRRPGREALAIVTALCLIGCGASTLDGHTGDGGADAVITPTADAAADVGGVLDAMDVAVGIPDAAFLDRSLPDIVDDAPPDGAPYVVQLAVSSQIHQCVLMNDSTVHCRGRNSVGELGIGTIGLPVTNAVTVPGLTGVMEVITHLGYESTCALLESGTVRCWGDDTSGMLGTGGVGDMPCTVGTETSPCQPSPTPVRGLAGVAHLAAAQIATCTVGGDGIVWCWGSLAPGGSRNDRRPIPGSEATAGVLTDIRVECPETQHPTDPCRWVPFALLHTLEVSEIRTSYANTYDARLRTAFVVAEPQGVRGSGGNLPVDPCCGQ